MFRQDLEQKVADATGEDLKTIRRRGFHLLELATADTDFDLEELQPQVYDWDFSRAKPLIEVA